MLSLFPTIGRTLERGGTRIRTLHWNSPELLLALIRSRESPLCSPPCNGATVRRAEEAPSRAPRELTVKGNAGPAFQHHRHRCLYSRASCRPSPFTGRLQSGTITLLM
jgi:hypothetical protein